MNNQKELNSCSVQQASALISMELSKKKSGLEEERQKLHQARAKYEEDYIAANAQGDARENAPLDEAISNLRFVTGEIMANAKILQALEGIEDVDYLLSTFDWVPLTTAYEQLDDNSKSLFNNAVGVLLFNDIAEVLSKESADVLLDAFDVYYNSVGGESADETNRKFIKELRNIRKVIAMPKYNHCGIVVPYSTVRLQLGEDVMTYKIYPEGLSFIDIGVMAADSRVAQAIMGRQKGDTVSIQHASRPLRLEYHILDIF